MEEISLNPTVFFFLRNFFVEEPEEPEPDFYTLTNPCRITRSQQQYVSLEPNSRYELVNDRVTKEKGIWTHFIQKSFSFEVLTGFVCLRDKNPSDEVKLVHLQSANGNFFVCDGPPKKTFFLLF